VNRTTKKTVRKTVAAKKKKIVAPTPSTKATSPASNHVDSLTTALLEAKSPEEVRESGKRFMLKMLGDTSRLRNQMDFTHRQYAELVADINDRFDYFDRCLGILFSTVGHEMPQRMPRLLDAKVELVLELNKGEICEMQSSFSEKKHPTFGHIQVVVGTDDEAKTCGIGGVHPIIAHRLTEAFTAMRETKMLVDGQFYYVRLHLIHSRPIGPESVRIDHPVAAASNDTGQVPQ
jgi:hypothetical protein